MSYGKKYADNFYGLNSWNDSVPSWSEQIADSADYLFPDPEFEPQNTVLNEEDLKDLDEDPF